MAARVVCISRTLAASGEDIARAVAGELGFRLVDAEIIARAAEKAGVEPRRVHEAEQRQPLLRRLLTSVRSPGAAGDRAYEHEAALSEAAAASGEATQARLRALIRDTIGEVATEGRVVIVAHAASMALGGREDVLRVLVTASPDTRARRLVQLSRSAWARPGTPWPSRTGRETTTSSTSTGSAWSCRRTTTSSSTPTPSRPSRRSG
jgi:hypothetical protein